MRDEPGSEELSGDSDGYEPPEVIVLGTSADLTQGIVPTSTDGVLPGSLL